MYMDNCGLSMNNTHQKSTTVVDEQKKKKMPLYLILVYIYYI